MAKFIDPHARRNVSEAFDVHECPDPRCAGSYTMAAGQSAAPLACPLCGTHFSAAALVFVPPPQVAENAL